MQYTQYLLNNKEIYLVDMKQATKPFSVLVEKTIQRYAPSKNISLITNKNSFAHGVICKDC
jgi:hypothetical protein